MTGRAPFVSLRARDPDIHRALPKMGAYKAR